MFEFTCPKCRTNSVVATLPRAAVSACRGCGQSLRISAADEAPRGWGSPLLFAVSALSGLTIAALLVLGWAFFGRSDGERDDPSRVAQESQSTPEKKPGLEKKPDPEKKPGQEKKPGEEKTPSKEDDLLNKIATKPNALSGEQVYQQLLKSCVWIVASDASGSWTGSGSLVDHDERLVLTNHHVANTTCKKIEVLFPLYDSDGKLVAENKAYWAALNKGEGLPAEVVWEEPKQDLALLRLTKELPKGVAAIRRARRSVNPGQSIHTVGGNPKGNQGQWIHTDGTVRQVVFNQFGKLAAQMIVSQMPINPGDSGGPVVDTRCLLVGVNVLLLKDRLKKEDDRSIGIDKIQLNSGHIDISEVNSFLKICYEKKLGKQWKEPEDEAEVQVAKADLETVRTVLRKGDARAREKAAQLLAEFGPAARRAVPDLLTLSRNSQEERPVREAADRALSEIGPPDREDFAALEAALTDVKAPGAHARLYAADALAKLTGQGRQAAQALVKGLDDPEIDVRRIVVSALGKIGWTAREEVFDGLLKAIKDKEPTIRMLALVNLLRLGKPELPDVSPLKKLLVDRSSGREGRLYAAVTLGEFDSPDFVPPYVDALQNDTDSAVLKVAALRLGALKVRSKEVSQALDRALSFPEEKVRLAAATALGMLGLDDTTLPAILKVMQGKDAACRTAVLERAVPVLGALDPNAPRLSLSRNMIDQIKPLLRHSEASTRAFAAYLLGTMGRDAAAALPELRAILSEEKTVAVQLEVLCALLAMGAEAKPALDELKTVMNDTDEQKLGQRLLAALAVVAVTNKDAAEREPAYRVLVEALILRNSEAPDPRKKLIHERAKAALAKGGKPAARRIVDFYRARLAPARAGFEADALHARRAALVVLSQIGRAADDPPVYRLLHNFIKGHDNPTVVQAAKEAFEAIYPNLKW